MPPHGRGLDPWRMVFGGLGFGLGIATFTNVRVVYSCLIRLFILIGHVCLRDV